MLQIVVIIACGALIAYLARLIKPYVSAQIARSKGSLPGGPPSYPIIGTLGIDDDEPWALMTKWNNLYGKDGMFTFFLGPQLQVVITDAELVRTLLKDPRLDGRPDTNLKRIFSSHALAFSEGTVWKDIRRFEIMALKDFGRGSGSKNLLEEYCQQAATDLVADVQEEAARGAFSTRSAILKCVANSIATTLCSTALKSDDPRFARLTDNVNVVFTEGTTPNSPLNVFPWLTAIPPFRQQQANVVSRITETLQMMQEVLDEHRANFDPDNVRDFMDAYLKEQTRHVDEGSASSFTDRQLLFMSIEMYFAGLDATLATLQWGMLLLSSNPRVLAKCQEEIDRVLGSTVIPQYTERHLLPYCEAMMNEVSRIGTVDPFGLPHRCLEDTPILNYVIPKDATVIVNYHGIHMSEKLWKDPHTFRPERFLDDQGKFQANPNNLPFATGRRMCSGDNFAKMIVFISMVSLIQRFNFRRVDTKPWTEIKRINGVGVHPDEFMLTATVR
ncbi:Cytochrome P450 2J6 [Hypsibius exemplaris]|uniref:Cytochrome P450 2J6 n=1 Tax=Hypsibius exemplaris TaxID=2072580 RepID=A0A1W0W8H9_HYPEX|nr:Cytochrome P450 2J6 [Hypsibius exemplaris]